MNEPCHTYEWVISHIMNESCHSYEWVMSHNRSPSFVRCRRYRRSHVTHMNASYHPREWVMSHIWMSHVTHMQESCHIYEWVMSHIWMSHITHTNESCFTYEWVMSRIWVGHATHMNESCHPYQWVMLHMWTNLNQSCHTYAGVMSHISMSRYECVMSHIWMSHVTHMNESCRTTGAHHSCAVDDAGGVTCWGSNARAQVIYSKIKKCRYDRVISHICVVSYVWVSHVTHVNKSCAGAVTRVSPNGAIECVMFFRTYDA